MIFDKVLISGNKDLYNVCSYKLPTEAMRWLYYK